MESEPIYIIANPQHSLGFLESVIMSQSDTRIDWRLYQSWED